MTVKPLATDDYETQLADKIVGLKKVLFPFCIPVLEIFPSPAVHYRMRAKFRIWHEGNDICHIMFHPHTHKRIRVDSFTAANKLINRLMPILIEAIRGNPILRDKLFQIDYLTSLNDKILVSLLYHRAIDAKWLQQATSLRDNLRTDGLNVHLIGRASKIKLCLDQDFIDEKLPVDGILRIYRQTENSFTQPNAAVAIRMLGWAIEVTKNSEGDLLELF